MDLEVLLAIFWAMFLAELGDKTQVAVLALGAAGKRRVSVFIGASAALVLSTLIAVALAEVVSTRVNPWLTQGLAGALLIVVMGGIYLVGALRPAAG
ncbi:TMEM165/GDT1 family protein [Sorangium sp. So ce315]|uniref:TMEM165/GDT1 family protein n=1 Tax=Sorangium sp. So ce315 TaxID=3133299 RepID=UPI003F5E353A